MQPKVLVGCPTSFHKEYALQQYTESLKKIVYKNHDILLVDNSRDDTYSDKIKEAGLSVIKGAWSESARERIITSRNILRQKVLDGNYDYLFSLEQDVIPPKDILERLIKHNKKVITAVYFANNMIPGETLSKLIPLAYVLEDEKTLSMRPLNEDELWKNQGLMKIISAGLGCVLIHRDVLKEVQFRYDLNSFDDRWFFLDLYNKNIPVYADTSIKCKHLIYNRPYPWSKIKK
ncbi:glycosyltransferase family 2 protein [Candidatus Woesearchaeota archaeon]|nr:glycosyltransferase family 2 protein [Candidatus Woesearchaeota archaeon]